MKTTGYVFYYGASALDPSSDVVGIVTLASGNRKIGNMLQTWILRADVAPHDAVRTGDDAAICGDCPHRAGSCYVLTFQGPLAIWRAWKAGRYPRADLAAVLRQHGRPARMGAYGDPAAIPAAAWAGIERHARTGYTHQWRRDGAAWLQPLAMASVDSWRELETAEAQGWRAFLVLPPGAPIPDRSPMGRRIVQCPADSHGAQCADCRLCDGRRDTAYRDGTDGFPVARPDRRPHIAIHAHGSGAARIAARAAEGGGA